MLKPLNAVIITVLSAEKITGPFQQMAQLDPLSDVHEWSVER